MSIYTGLSIELTPRIHQEIYDSSDDLGILYKRFPHKFPPALSDSYPYLCADHEVDIEEFENAIKVIAKMMEQMGSVNLAVDFASFNKAHAPAKEMTLEEIERALGHKVKIVNGGKNK